MSILITGGAGYIGSHIAEQLVKKKINNIYILDNLSTGHKKLINHKSNFIKGDIKNLSLLKKIIKKHNIQTIIHLAAHLNVSEAEKKKLNTIEITLQTPKIFFYHVKIPMLETLFFPLLVQFMVRLKEM